MSEFKKHFIVPTIIALISAIIGVIIPTLIQKRKRVLYYAEPPISYIQPEQFGNLDIRVNGFPSSDLSTYCTTIVNIGDFPVQDLGVNFTFSKPEKGFRILSEFQITTPKNEIGKLDCHSKDSCHCSYTYALLNPNDTIRFSFITLKTANMSIIFNKQPEAEFTDNKENSWYKQISNPLYGYSLIIFSVIASILTPILNKLKRK